MKRLLPVLLLGWSLATGCAGTLAGSGHGGRTGSMAAAVQRNGALDPGGRVIGTREGTGLDNFVGGGEGRTLTGGGDNGTAREPQFAGPTPQIPIPVLGGCSRE